MDNKASVTNQNVIGKDRHSLQNQQENALEKAFSSLFDMHAPADLYRALSVAIKDIILSPTYQYNQAFSEPTDLIMLLDLKESLLNCTLLLSPTAQEDILSLNENF